MKKYFYSATGRVISIVGKRWGKGWIFPSENNIEEIIKDIIIFTRKHNGLIWEVINNSSIIEEFEIGDIKEMVEEAKENTPTSELTKIVYWGRRKRSIEVTILSILKKRTYAQLKTIKRLMKKSYPIELAIELELKRLLESGLVCYIPERKHYVLAGTESYNFGKRKFSKRKKEKMSLDKRILRSIAKGKGKFHQLTRNLRDSFSLEDIKAKLDEMCANGSIQFIQLKGYILTEKKPC